MDSKTFSRQYDEDVNQQGQQQQIDTYYEPKKPSDKLRIQIVLDALRPGQGEMILDVGCGVGTFAFHAAKFYARTTGIDHSKVSIAMARSICRQYTFFEKITFAVSDAMELPFKRESFDKVVSVDFIEHINNNEKSQLLREVYRVLKPGGIVVVFTPNNIRERIGAFHWKMRHMVFGSIIPSTDLHFGLTSRSEFESLIIEHGFDLRFAYRDITRPFLARIPMIRSLLALNLLWILRKP